jgi:S1-C subfamily serine protease
MLSKQLVLIFCLTAFLCVYNLVSARNRTSENIVDENIVKIYVTANEHSYHTPWQMLGSEEYEGSGCIIVDQLVLTNAHVVSDQTFITVKRSGQTKKYVATVKFVAHECDLALLEVKDSAFFPDVKPLEIGKLPHMGDVVAVYGYPSGAEQLTVTQGIVSRVSHEEYEHSSRRLLCCQIDAPINEGNSGGPVISDGKIIGIAMMVGWGENEGFMVSVPVIQNFLKDIEDGAYNGIPAIGITYQSMENPYIRKYYGMGDEQEGVLIRKVCPDSSAQGVLREDDVVLAIDGINIANDGTVAFRGSERTGFGYLVQNKQMGESITVQYLRDRVTRETTLKLTKGYSFCRLVPYYQYDIEPMYYICGGIIFSPLTENIIYEFEDDEWYYDVMVYLGYSTYFREPTEDRSEAIAIIDVLSDEVNMGYEDLGWAIVTSANGKKIGSMNDLISAIESNSGEYHVFETENGKKIILDRAAADKSKKRILEQYKIPKEKSGNL